MENNIFYSLSKYNNLHDENYLTESFVYILNHLLDTAHREIVVKLINNLFLKNADFTVSSNEEIIIETQISEKEYGRPDIFIYIENTLIR